MSFFSKLNNFMNESYDQHTLKRDDKTRWDDICRAHKDMFTKNNYVALTALPEYQLKDLLTFSKGDFKSEYPYIDALNIFESLIFKNPNVDSSLTIPIEIQLAFYVKKIPYIWHKKKYDLKNSHEFKEALYRFKNNLLCIIDSENLIDNQKLSGEIDIFGNDIVQIASKIFLNIYYTTEYGDYPKKYEIDNNDISEYGAEFIGYLSNLALIEVFKQSSKDMNLISATNQAPNIMATKFGDELSLLITKLSHIRYTTYTRR